MMGRLGVRICCALFTGSNAVLSASTHAEVESVLGEAGSVVYVSVYAAAPQDRHSPDRADRVRPQSLASAGLACEFARACFHR